jgi:hypothetical protein
MNSAIATYWQAAAVFVCTAAACQYVAIALFIT